jgi:hypothetical protein
MMAGLQVCSVRKKSPFLLNLMTNIHANTQDARALSANCSDFLTKGLEQLGKTSVEVFNQGVRLRRMVERLSFSKIDGTHWSPELGLALNEEEILGVYGMREGGRRVIEFDFGGGAALLRFTEVCTPDIASTYTPVFAKYLAFPISANSLAVLRDALDSPLRICAQCVHDAKQRVARIEALPLHRILCELTEIDSNFMFMKPRPHTEITASINFQSVRIHGGVIALHAEHEGSQLDVDVRFVHRLNVNKGRYADEELSMLDFYNQHGFPILRITSSMPDMAARWIEACEGATS